MLGTAFRTAARRLVPFPYRCGLTFTRHWRWLAESQWWPRQRQEAFQNRMLRRLIEHAYANVAHWYECMRRRGIRPEHIHTAADLKLLPVLTKEQVRSNAEKLRARNWRTFRPVEAHTSGSTGEPVTYLLDRNLICLTQALVSRHWSWARFNPNDRIAVFRGTLIDDFGTPREKHFKVIGNQIHFSTFRMSEDIVASYAETLAKFRPGMIRGYPSALAIVARCIRKFGVRIRPPTLIHVSSEVLTGEQRELLQETFRCPVFNWYSHGESAVAAGDCQEHNGFHVNTEFGIVELLPTSEGPPEARKMVATSLWNYAMPFIRYDTEDLAVPGDGSACPCGRTLPRIERVIGRVADIITGVNGTRLPPTSLYHFWKHKISTSLTEIRFYQLVQTSPTEICVRVVMPTRRDYEEFIGAKLTELLGPMRFSFEYLTAVPGGEKWRFSVCRFRSSQGAFCDT